MRTLAVIGAVSLVLAASAAGGSEARGKPTLKLVSGTALTLRGAHFATRERVRVTVTTDRRLTKRVTASGSGAFVVRFDLVYDRCSGLFALATGTEGSRATLKMPQLGCPPSL
jgi:hypothetical protein